ncbi:MAG TPA: hypothetical protein VKV28_10255 [Candidatus Binataceae bacterium]|nr:hypothetical protein [Candidatus Binataceae bacterium]
MSDPRIAAFARLASGNSEPLRIIQGQKTKITRAAHGITYDPGRDEIIASEPLAAAILTFPGGADGQVAPIRVLQGPHTQLHRPYQEVVDDVHKELIVADDVSSAILVFPWDANGDTPPLRVIQGPKTGMKTVVGVGVDPQRNLIVAAADRGLYTWDHQGGLYIFNRTDNGNVAPRAVIAGPHTGISSPWHLALYQGKIYAAISRAVGVGGEYIRPYDRSGYLPKPGCKGPPNLIGGPLGFVGVWYLTDNGDVPPHAILKGTRAPHPSSIAINPAEGEIYTGERDTNGVYAFIVPRFFSGGDGFTPGDR